MVDSASSPPDAQHDLPMRVTLTGLADLEDPLFISSDDRARPLEDSAWEVQLSADVETPLVLLRSVHVGATDRALSLFQEIAVHSSRWTGNN